MLRIKSVQSNTIRRLCIFKKYFLFLLTVLIASSLFAKAQSDIQLVEVDRLIEERRINEALALAEKYIQENPRDFDNAQKRVAEIFKLRDDYKAKADELVRIIVEEPLNDRLKLDIIEELENMEQNPNAEEKEFIARVKSSAQFTYFRALYEQIVAEGTALYEEQEYAAAVTRFNDGFVLYYEDFFESGFDEALVAEADDRVDIVQATYPEYSLLQTDFASIFDQFNQYLVSNNVAGALGEYENVVQVLEEYAQLRNTNILAGFYFEEQTQILQDQDASLTDAFFLPFAFRLLLGRGDETEANIVKIMDAQWNNMYAETQTNLATMIEYYSSILNEDLAEKTLSQLVANTTSLTSQIDLLNSILTMGGDFLSQYELLNATSTTFAINPHVEYQNVLNYNTSLMAKTSTLLEYGNAFTAQTQSLASYVAPASPDSIIRNANQEYSTFLITSSETTESYAQDASTEVSELEIEEGLMGTQSLLFTEMENILYPSLVELSQTLETHFDTLVTENYAQALIARETLSDFLEQGSSIIQLEYEVPYTQAVLAVNEDLDITVQSDPEYALETLEVLLSTIEQDIVALQGEYDFLSNVPENTAIGVQASLVYAEDQANILDDITYLQDISEISNEYIILAEQRLRFAQQAQNEGDLRVSQARDYLDQENFTESRASLQRARTQYNEALSYQYSEALQTETDEELAALGAEISFIENEIVVRNVRNFITNSRESYYNSDFLQAESLILQAESQWALTNVQENPEIIALKALIGNALSITTGRSIPATDPLYPEMSQTLNVAYQHFGNAESLLDRNNRDAALAELELARNKIRDVQVLYPFHQEASLLALQIDQLIDPVAFAEQFEQKFEQAQEDYLDPATSARAYIDLLDLFEINPDYPGLEDFIYIVELELGIILPPPDYAAIARAESLTQDAEDIYDSGARDEISLNNALALLNEAIELDAQNQDALILLDRINTSLGGAAVIVLSSQAENLYQQAVQELANGNTITAAALVTQLMQLPGVENSSKIIDLQRRVESLL